MSPEDVVDAIIKDLCARSGLQNEWDQIDEDMQNEIRETWVEIVKKGR